MNNPYSMPQSHLGEIAGDETYDPEFFSAEGRIGRLRYWSYSIGAGVLLMFLDGVALFLAGMAGKGLATFVSLILTFLSFVVGVILARRRLHDLGKSAWMGILLIIPLVNVGVALWLLFAPGDAEANEYGPPPAPNTTGVKIVGGLVPVIFLAIIFAVAIPAYQAYMVKASATQMGE